MYRPLDRWTARGEDGRHSTAGRQDRSDSNKGAGREAANREVRARTSMITPNPTQLRAEVKLARQGKDNVLSRMNPTEVDLGQRGSPAAGKF